MSVKGFTTCRKTIRMKSVLRLRTGIARCEFCDAHCVSANCCCRIIPCRCVVCLCSAASVGGKGGCPGSRKQSTSTAECTVQVESRADERQMSECLRKVSQGLTTGS